MELLLNHAVKVRTFLLTADLVSVDVFGFGPDNTKLLVLSCNENSSCNSQ